MANYHIKPLKKAGIIFAILVFLLALLAWFFGRSAKVPAPENYFGKIRDTNTEQAVNLDSDNDGLKDWEETIYHTDPKSKDTDRDGTGDGEEIAANRNPLKAGPDDISAARDETLDTVSQGYARLKNLSEQGNITQALVSQIINKQGITSFLNSKQTKNAVSELEGYLGKLKALPEFSEDAISDATLTITSDIKPEAAKAYFNSVASVYEKYIFPLGKDDLAIVSSALESENPSKLKEIAPFIAASEKTLESVRKISVPQHLLLFHKKELFFLKNTVEGLNLLQNASLADALYVALLMNMRIELKKEAEILHHTDLPLWLEKNHISFAPGEKALLIYYRNK